ncbi:MAG TPA: AmmeMemoRadiSam system protein A [Bacteroidales bacterium]|nr:AmmeMemoRadiSam system protein A [Bacteroidales bacterium]
MDNADKLIFSDENKEVLLNIAWRAITDYLESGALHKLTDDYKVSDTLKSKRGVFVSVYVDKKLRGCIGTFSESTPLVKNVHRLAVQAAFEDRRFSPVRNQDLSAMEIEISVLTKRTKVDGPEYIEIGKHGIYLVHGDSKATLLPQVATENGFNAVEFLECCATNKLKMDKEAWKEAEIYVYEAKILK